MICITLPLDTISPSTPPLAPCGPVLLILTALTSFPSPSPPLSPFRSLRVLGAVNMVTILDWEKVASSSPFTSRCRVSVPHTPCPSQVARAKWRAYRLHQTQVVLCDCVHSDAPVPMYATLMQAHLSSE